MSPLKKIKSWIEKYLHLEIKTTVVPQSIPLSGNGTNNLYVAFTGLPGSGKSTLRRYYLKHSALGGQREIITYKKLWAHAKNLHDKLEGVHQRLLFYQVYQSQENINRKLEIIKMDYVAKTFFKNKIFLLDTRNIFREIPKITDFLAQEEKSDFLRNRVIVHFDIGSKELIKRIIKRKYKTGKIHHFHENLSQDEESYLFINKQIEEENSKVEKIRQMGVPILIINAEESLSKNTCRVDKFILDQYIVP